MIKSLTTQHENQESSPPKTKKKSGEHGTPLVIPALWKHREGIP